MGTTLGYSIVDPLWGNNRHTRLPWVLKEAVEAYVVGDEDDVGDTNVGTATPVVPNTSFFVRDCNEIQS